jgi:DnaJ-class molecular chaperone
MAKRKRRQPLPSIKCPACNGSGFAKVQQPTRLGRRIYAARCHECRGNGRMPLAVRALMF